MEDMKRYYNLLQKLNGHIVVGNDDHKRLITVAKIYKLTAIELQTNNFQDICDAFDKKGLLSPKNLSILKEIFPEKENIHAYRDIVETEKKISDIQKSSKRKREEANSETAEQVDGGNLQCYCKKELKPQTEVIEINTAYKYEKPLSESQVHNMKLTVKKKMRNFWKNQDFSMNIGRQKWGYACIFLETRNSTDNSKLVEQMEKTFIPSNNFMCDWDMDISQKEDKFCLKIKTKFRYDVGNHDMIWQRKKTYQSDMTKLLQRTGKNVKVSLVGVTEKSEKEFVEFTIESNDFTTEELNIYLEENCCDPTFEEISLKVCKQEHIHACWLHTNETCRMKDILENQLIIKKEESEIYDFSICLASPASRRS